MNHRYQTSQWDADVAHPESSDWVEEAGSAEQGDLDCAQNKLWQTGDYEGDSIKNLVLHKHVPCRSCSRDYRMWTVCCRGWLSLELFYASENFYRKLWQTSWRREFPSSPPPSKISMFTQVIISYHQYPCSWLVETTYPCLWLVNLSLPCQDLLMNQVWWLSWPVPVVTTGKYLILIGWDNLYSLRIGWYSTILISDWLTYYNTNIWLVDILQY